MDMPLKHFAGLLVYLAMCLWLIISIIWQEIGDRSPQWLYGQVTAPRFDFFQVESPSVDCTVVSFLKLYRLGSEVLKQTTSDQSKYQNKIKIKMFQYPFLYEYKWKNTRNFSLKACLSSGFCLGCRNIERGLLLFYQTRKNWINYKSWFFLNLQNWYHNHHKA